VLVSRRFANVHRKSVKLNDGLKLFAGSRMVFPGSTTVLAERTA